MWAPSSLPSVTAIGSTLPILIFFCFWSCYQSRISQPRLSNPYRITLKVQEGLQPWDMALLSKLKGDTQLQQLTRSHPPHITPSLLPLSQCISPTFSSVYSSTSKGPIFVKKYNTVQRLGRASHTDPTGASAKTQKPKSKSFFHLIMKPLLLAHKTGSFMSVQCLLLQLFPLVQK